jgi:hypothetical protein
MKIIPGKRIRMFLIAFFFTLSVILTAIGMILALMVLQDMYGWPVWVAAIIIMISALSGTIYATVGDD